MIKCDPQKLKLRFEAALNDVTITTFVTKIEHESDEKMTSQKLKLKINMIVINYRKMQNLKVTLSHKM